MTKEKTNLANNPWPKKIEFLSLSSWLIISAGLAVISKTMFGQGFRGYYAAARVLLAGGNPYDYHEAATVLYDYAPLVIPLFLHFLYLLLQGFQAIQVPKWAHSSARVSGRWVG